MKQKLMGRDRKIAYVALFIYLAILGSFFEDSSTAVLWGRRLVVMTPYCILLFGDIHREWENVSTGAKVIAPELKGGVVPASDTIAIDDSKAIEYFTLHNDQLAKHGARM